MIAFEIYPPCCPCHPPSPFIPRLYSDILLRFRGNEKKGWFNAFWNIFPSVDAFAYNRIFGRQPRNQASSGHAWRCRCCCCSCLLLFPTPSFFFFFFRYRFTSPFSIAFFSSNKKPIDPKHPLQWRPETTFFSNVHTIFIQIFFVQQI